MEARAQSRIQDDAASSTTRSTPPPSIRVVHLDSSRDLSSEAAATPLPPSPAPSRATPHQRGPPALTSKWSDTPNDRPRSSWYRRSLIGHAKEMIHIDRHPASSDLSATDHESTPTRPTIRHCPSQELTESSPPFSAFTSARPVPPIPSRPRFSISAESLTRHSADLPRLTKLSRKPMWTSNAGKRSVDVAARVKTALHRAATRLGAGMDGTSREDSAGRRPAKLRKLKKKVTSPSKVVHVVSLDQNGMLYGPISLPRSSARDSPPRQPLPPFIETPIFDAFAFDTSRHYSSDTHRERRAEGPSPRETQGPTSSPRIGVDTPTQRRPLQPSQPSAHTGSPIIGSPRSQSTLVALFSLSPAKENCSPHICSPRPRSAKPSSRDSLVTESDTGTLTSIYSTYYPSPLIDIQVTEPTPPKTADSRPVRGLTKSKTSSNLSSMLIDYLEPPLPEVKSTTANVDVAQAAPSHPAETSFSPPPGQAREVTEDDLEAHLAAHAEALRFFEDEEDEEKENSDDDPVAEDSSAYPPPSTPSELRPEWLQDDLFADADEESPFEDAEEGCEDSVRLSNSATFGRTLPAHKESSRVARDLRPNYSASSLNSFATSPSVYQTPASFFDKIPVTGDEHDEADDLDEHESPTLGRRIPLPLVARRHASPLLPLTLPPRNPYLPDIEPSCYHSDTSTISTTHQLDSFQHSGPNEDDDSPISAGPHLAPPPSTPLPPTPSTLATTPFTRTLLTSPSRHERSPVALRHCKSAHSLLGGSFPSVDGHSRSRSEGTIFKASASVQTSPEKVSVVSLGRREQDLQPMRHGGGPWSS